MGDKKSVVIIILAVFASFFLSQIYTNLVLKMMKPTAALITLSVTFVAFTGLLFLIYKKSE